MPLFRRARRSSPDPEMQAARRAFDAAAESLDAAQRALLAAVPTSRHPGVPLAQGLAEFESGLREVERRMTAWRVERLEAEWRRCAAALADAQAEAERLRLDGAVLGFEALNARIGDVLHPLEVFAEVEESLRAR